ncbi:TIGR04325 family methyltransferase [Rhizobacter sp. Root1221]|uniref:TIGR04325 family methyltransferase n=1 Tax=Rhizobacter sp. Root1221 TaxID=1736433 RepID=UPI0009EA514B|nr:TIGR04325 family methyltransferase [Rhizobacter sp. Root1221]
MSLVQRIHTAIEVGARAPVVRRFVESSFEREFVANRDRNMFWGVFDSFESAARKAECYGVSGYDNEASADMYLTHMRPDAFDYPAMFWLRKSFDAGLRRVSDVGGSVGIKFYAYRKSIPLPPDVDWTVVDVPAVVSRGKALAAQKGVDPALHFTDDLTHQLDSDILFASGSLQYLPRTLGSYLRSWNRRPNRVVINITPIHPDSAYFTVNSIGTAFCPYRVQTHAGLIAELTQLGYSLKDTWANRGKALELPLRPDLSLDHYRGFCFDLAG